MIVPALVTVPPTNKIPTWPPAIGAAVAPLAPLAMLAVDTKPGVVIWLMLMPFWLVPIIVAALVTVTFTVVTVTDPTSIPSPPPVISAAVAPLAPLATLPPATKKMPAAYLLDALMVPALVTVPAPL